MAAALVGTFITKGTVLAFFLTPISCPSKRAASFAVTGHVVTDHVVPTMS